MVSLPWGVVKGGGHEKMTFYDKKEGGHQDFFLKFWGIIFFSVTRPADHSFLFYCI